MWPPALVCRFPVPAAAADLTEKIAAANRKRTTAARDGDGDPARPADRADAPPHTHPAAAAYLIE